MIGDDIKVTILGVNGGQARIGIMAPRDVSIHREEIYRRVLQERLQEQKGRQIGEQSSADGQERSK